MIRLRAQESEEDHGIAARIRVKQAVQAVQRALFDVGAAGQLADCAQQLLAQAGDPRIVGRGAVQNQQQQGAGEDRRVAPSLVKCAQERGRGASPSARTWAAIIARTRSMESPAGCASPPPRRVPGRKGLQQKVTGRCRSSLRPLFAPR